MTNSQFLKQIIIEQIKEKITLYAMFSNEKLKPEWLVDFSQKELTKMVAKFNKINQETITLDEFDIVNSLLLFLYCIEHNQSMSQKEQNLFKVILNEEVEIHDYKEKSVYAEYP